MNRRIVRGSIVIILCRDVPCARPQNSPNFRAKGEDNFWRKKDAGEYELGALNCRNASCISLS
ncbi:hypothetical protein LOAG_09897 [Loa loa]|uniref:Uncharacterized protein n=1 Tax=Loa loa TaxID=7209 RepID=A0A1S0TQS9_LOALO|nr:hypothetical protein LOAG_09897 [Loa loa]EFO18598.1 hypothetical protein LOAG_09897 [Loa loa]